MHYEVGCSPIITSIFAFRDFGTLYHWLATHSNILTFILDFVNAHPWCGAEKELRQYVVPWLECELNLQ